MTEAEWQTASDPRPMLAFLREQGTASERKLRLFAAACCRSVWPLLKDPDSRSAVEVCERFADGEATAEELNRADWSSDESYFRLDSLRVSLRLEDRLIGIGALPADEASDLSSAVLSLRVDAAYAANLATSDTDSFL